MLGAIAGDIIDRTRLILDSGLKRVVDEFNREFKVVTNVIT